MPNADIYQMLAYLTGLDLSNGLLVYAAGENVPPDLTITGAAKRVHVRTLEVTQSPIQPLASVKDLATVVWSLARGE